jgi:hypothetical protein
MEILLLLIGAGRQSALLLSKVVILNGVKDPRISFGAERLSLAAKALPDRRS